MTTNSRRLTSRDLLRFHMCDDPQVSPDGREVAWVRTWIDAEANSYRSHIFVTGLESGSTRRLTSGPGLDSYPRWSPDGRFIAYLATTPAATSASVAVPHAVAALGSGPQLMVIAASGGKSHPLTNLPGGARFPAWSPDGSRIAITTLVEPQRGLATVGEADPLDEEGNEPLNQFYARYNRDVLVTHRLRWKSDGLGLLGDHFHQIALIPFNENLTGLPAPALLYDGLYDLSPPVWSPDGRHLASTGNLSPNGEALRKSFIYLFPVDGPLPATPLELCSLEEMRSSDLSFSPDGSLLAVCGHDDPVIGHYGTPHLWLITVATGEKRCLTRHVDRALGDYSRNADLRRYGGDDEPRWLPDGSGLLVLLNEAGTVHLNQFDLGSGQMTPRTSGDSVVTAFSMDNTGERVVLLLGDSLNPGDLYLLETNKPGQPRRLTAVNEALLAEVELSPALRFSCESGGVQIEGWVNPPLGREAGQRYPVILYTGGGPGGMRASVFVHEFQLYAAHGYAVINCNTRGNHGYGEPFSAATRGHWGDLDYEDNMAFLRAACTSFDFIDSERMAVAGGSYGGYSAAWIIARHPEFRAAVVDRSLVNRTSQVGTSDIGFLLDQVEFDKKLPWENVATLLERSPLLQVAGVQTPTLVVHSAMDYRCAVEQGEQYYMALKRLGVPTELVRFPNETHELSRSGRPWHRVFRLDKYLDWFRRWL
ncbi:MAG: S9 family peptidase [Chloroflexaceae bacterium]|jgi:dipeptidyl aminopeptidase/acylaminoacyl peptidase|nr:S9 family peptidase [Chloroflexaceae bacterium]